MAEARQLQRYPPQQGEETRFVPRGAILRVDPSVAENLFKGITYNLPSEVTLKEIEDQLRAELSKTPSKVAALIHFGSRVYFQTLLGGQIIPPQARQVLMDRVSQFAQILFQMELKRIRELKAKIQQKALSGEAFEQELQEIEEEIVTYFIAIREFINRMLTVLYINAPANVRPPLANVKLGFEILR
jgi:hypothetical protein